MTKLAWGVSNKSLGFLALFGTNAARAGGSPVFMSAARATFWVALATGLAAASAHLWARGCNGQPPDGRGRARVIRGQKPKTPRPWIMLD